RGSLEADADEALIRRPVRHDDLVVHDRRVFRSGRQAQRDEGGLRGVDEDVGERDERAAEGEAEVGLAVLVGVVHEEPDGVARQVARLSEANLYHEGSEGLSECPPAEIPLYPCARGAAERITERGDSRTRRQAARASVRWLSGRPSRGQAFPRQITSRSRQECFFTAAMWCVSKGNSRRPAPCRWLLPRDKKS